MNREMIERLKEASKYEKMAIRALLPEKAAGHIEVIEGELHAMFLEFVMDAVKEGMAEQMKRAANSGFSENTSDETNEHSTSEEGNMTQKESLTKKEHKTKEVKKTREVKIG